MGGWCSPQETSRSTAAAKIYFLQKSPNTGVPTKLPPPQNRRNLQNQLRKRAHRSKQAQPSNSHPNERTHGARVVSETCDSCGRIPESVLVPSSTTRIRRGASRIQTTNIPSADHVQRQNYSDGGLRLLGDLFLDASGVKITLYPHTGPCSRLCSMSKKFDV